MGENEKQNGVGDNTYGGKAIVSFPAESIILREGEINLDMYKIIQGRAEMYVGYGTEQEVLLGIIGPGACFGELGLLMKSPAIYTVIAYSDLYAIRVTEDRLGSFIQSNHTTAIQIMQNMANTMSIMQHQIVSLSEELQTCNKMDKNEISNLKKDLVKNYSIYNPRNSGTIGMSGKMHFLGTRK